MEEKKEGSIQGFLRDQLETWAEREFEICNGEGSLKGGKKKKNVEAFRYCVRKQRVWKLPTFLLYRFAVTAVYPISFLPVFLSTRCINTNKTCLLRLRYLYISVLFCPIICFMVSIFLIKFYYNFMWFQLLSVTLIS